MGTKRRRFSREFKLEALRLAAESGRTSFGGTVRMLYFQPVSDQGELTSPTVVPPMTSPPLDRIRTGPGQCRDFTCPMDCREVGIERPRTGS